MIKKDDDLLGIKIMHNDKDINYNVVQGIKDLKVVNLDNINLYDVLLQAKEGMKKKVLTSKIEEKGEKIIIT